MNQNKNQNKQKKKGKAGGLRGSRELFLRSKKEKDGESPGLQMNRRP